MEDDVKTLGDYISIAWRRKFYILIPFTLVFFISIAVVLRMPLIYQSTGTILIESQQIPEELVQSTVTSFAAERIQVLKQRILAGDQLLEIIKKFNLYGGQENLAPRSAILDDMRRKVFIELVSADVRGRRRNASAVIAFTVSFEDQDPAAAQKVTNELVTRFLDENIKTRTSRAEEATEFLKKESERLGAQIAVIEEQIATYKQENAGSLPESLGANLGRVVTLRTALDDSESQEQDLIEQRSILLVERDTLRAQAATSGGLTEEQLQRQQDLVALQNQFISLSARYGSEHPDVKAIKRQMTAFENEYDGLADIEELKTQEKDAQQELADLTQKYSAEHPDVKKLERKLESIVEMIAEFESNERAQEENQPNPELRLVEARIESLDSNIERLRNSKQDLQGQIDRLNNLIARTPQVERGLDALERDYENTNQKYQEMKDKELQAELSQSLEQNQKGERFTLLEPPLLPDVPIKPSRKKLMLFAIVMSLAGGFGIAGLVEFLGGGIRGSRALASVTKLTPLVVIPYIATRRDEEIKRRNNLILIFVAFILCIVFFVMIHFLYQPLDQLWFNLLLRLKLA